MNAPAMQPNYLSTEKDRQTLIAGIRLARSLPQPCAQTLRKRRVPPGASAGSDADLLEFAKNTGGTIFHPSGTCKMGTRRSLAVVDHQLRVHGVDGLRVVDCSAMPTVTSGNTNVPVVMIAEKAADMILAAAERFGLIPEKNMPCCHVDFALTETSDKAFTVGMPTFTFGAGCLAEAGDHAKELSLKRVALFTDRGLAASPHLATVRASLEAAGIAADDLRRSRRRALDASFKAAARSQPKAISTAMCRSVAGP